MPTFNAEGKEDRTEAEVGDEEEKADGAGW